MRHACAPAEAAASEEWHEAASAPPARVSHGSSRYFSLAESEFEDAASQLASELDPGGRWGPGLALVALVLGQGRA